MTEQGGRDQEDAGRVIALVARRTDDEELRERRRSSRSSDELEPVVAVAIELGQERRRHGHRPAARPGSRPAPSVGACCCAPAAARSIASSRGIALTLVHLCPSCRVSPSMPQRIESSSNRPTRPDRRVCRFRGCGIPRSRHGRAVHRKGEAWAGNRPTLDTVAIGASELRTEASSTAAAHVVGRRRSPGLPLPSRPPFAAAALVRRLPSPLPPPGGRSAPSRRASSGRCPALLLLRLGGVDSSVASRIASPSALSSQETSLQETSLQDTSVPGDVTPETASQETSLQETSLQETAYPGDVAPGNVRPGDRVEHGRSRRPLTRNCSAPGSGSGVHRHQHRLHRVDLTDATEPARPEPRRVPAASTRS